MGFVVIGEYVDQPVDEDNTAAANVPVPAEVRPLEFGNRDRCWAWQLGHGLPTEHSEPVFFLSDPPNLGADNDGVRDRPGHDIGVGICIEVDPTGGLRDSINTRDRVFVMVDPVEAITHRERYETVARTERVYRRERWRDLDRAAAGLIAVIEASSGIAGEFASDADNAAEKDVRVVVNEIDQHFD